MLGVVGLKRRDRAKVDVAHPHLFLLRPQLIVVVVNLVSVDGSDPQV
jgi:hypothetical protein